MKKLHGIRVVAHGQKRHLRLRQKHARANMKKGMTSFDLLTNIYKGYPEHSLHRRF